MSQHLSVYVDDKTMKRLLKAAEETGRDIETLAGDGVSEYMALGFRGRPKDDPGAES